MAIAPPAEQPMSRDEYEALVRRGVLDEARVELVDGRIYSVTPHGDEHASTIHALMKLLVSEIDVLHVQMPLALGPTSEPEPDLALADRDGFRHPRTARLVIEVIWSPWHEAVRKLPVYADAGVGECWLVDIPARQVHVHDQPSGRAYGRTRTLTGADVLTPPGTDVRFTVADVFAHLDE